MMILFLYEEIFNNILFPFPVPSILSSEIFLSLLGRSVFVIKNLFLVTVENFLLILILSLAYAVVIWEKCGRKIFSQDSL